MVIVFMGTLGAKAYDFEVEGIYYDIASSEDKTASITRGDSYYTGSIVIPQSVTYNEEEYSVISIGEYAFQYCHDLTGITIPNSVTSIGNEAFSGCNKLASITIPNSVTTIGKSAFFGCGITSITIPNSVTDMGTWTFGCCTSLTSVTIPESVTSIGEAAFWQCSSLESITIPNSVTDIGICAFWECGLTTITIPNSVTSIGNLAFYWCDRLTTVNAESIEGWLGISFSGYYSNPLVYAHHLYLNGQEVTELNIPESITHIGDYAFVECSGLTTVNMSNSVKSIGNEAFARCTNLQYNVYDNAKYLGDEENPYVFLVEANSKKITSCEIHDDCQIIGGGAFSQCNDLSEINIPAKVSNIGSEAFSNCTGINPLTIPNTVTSIENYAFNMIKNVVYNGEATGSPWGALTINGTVDGDFIYADAGKTQLTAYIGKGGEVTIPETVTSIGPRAFSNCENITSVTIPETVISIGEAAFCNCTKLTTVNIPNSITSISDFTFESCHKLSSVTIPEHVTNIGKYAFAYCYDLKSVNIPESVTSIGSSAFYCCSRLGSVTIPNTITEISSDAFYHVKNIVYNGESTNAPWNALNLNGIVDGDFVYYDEEKTELSAYIGDGGDVTIPDKVVYIWGYSFEGYRDITSVTIPNSVTYIGLGAFQSCTGMTSVTIPNSVTAIGEDAFSTCRSLTSVVIPNSVTTILDYAFGGVKNIVYSGTATGSPWGALSVNGVIDGDFIYYDEEKTILLVYIGEGGDVTVPETVTSIAEKAFYERHELTSISIPNSVTYIGPSAFGYCTNLHYNEYDNAIYVGNAENPYLYLIEAKSKDITTCSIHEDCKVIGLSAFYGCSDMTSVSIPNSIKIIREYAFSGCTGLTSVKLPNTTNFIGEETFYGCSGMTSIYIPESVSAIRWDAFTGCENLTIYCEASSQPIYWNNRWNSEDRPVVWGYKNYGNALAEISASSASIYAYQNVIVVDNAEAETLVFDVTGRLVARKDATGATTKIQMARAGVYIVKVGTDVRRVVVGN